SPQQGEVGRGAQRGQTAPPVSSPPGLPPSSPPPAGGRDRRGSQCLQALGYHYLPLSEEEEGKEWGSQYPLHHVPDAVAVIGMAGQCPDAGDVETFWRNLVTGHDAVREFLPPGSAATHTPQWAGIVADRDCFDPLFFNIAPREALSMSLHQRLVMQESWKALE